MSWKIYYDDETVVVNKDMKWEDLPAHGVLFVLHYQKDGNKQIHMGADYYLMRKDTIMSFQIKDLHEHLLLGIGKGAVKFGRWCPDDVWKRVHDKVFQEK
jgi:hypothetical protein